MTVAWMLEAAAAVKSLYESMREDHEFDKIWESFEVYRKKLALEELILPRTRKPPARFCGDGEAFRSTTVKQHYRIEFRKIIDVAIQQLNQRLLQCPGLTSYCQLETMLVQGRRHHRSWGDISPHFCVSWGLEGTKFLVLDA
jgi:hypothetical protein